MQLVNILVHQLKGEVHLERHNGTLFMIEFQTRQEATHDR
jgi:two-component sensor histidine kinase